MALSLIGLLTDCTQGNGADYRFLDDSSCHAACVVANDNAVAHDDGQDPRSRHDALFPDIASKDLI